MIGSFHECALWYNADHPEDRDKAREGVIRGFFNTGDMYGVKFGPIIWDDVDPLSPRVPDPPEHIRGNVRCLIGTARVIDYLIEVPVSNLTEDLTEKDLRDLRKATRRAFWQHGGLNLTDEECDYLINEHGPDVAGIEILRKH